MRSHGIAAWILLALAPAPLACDDEEARVSFTVFPVEARFQANMLTVRFDDGSGSRSLTGADFEGDGGRADTREFPTRTSGTLQVEFVVAADPVTLAEGSVAIPLKTDWRWGVDFFLTDRDPTEMCFGCFGAAAFPLAPEYRTSDADSLWVVWGGNSISNPVVY